MPFVNIYTLILVNQIFSQVTLIIFCYAVAVTTVCFSNIGDPVFCGDRSIPKNSVVCQEGQLYT